MTTQSPSADSEEEVGAFGMAEDVDWEAAAFAAEDLSGRPVRPKKEAAPRPVEQTIPQARPALPVAAPHVAAVVPSPAPATPGTQSLAAPAPAPPAPSLPARPTPPPAVAPQSAADPASPIPVTSQAPEAAATRPAAVALPPLPTPTAPNGAPYSTTPGAGYAPATKASLEDLDPPEWARIVPTVTADEDENETPAFAGGGFEEPLYPTAPAAPATPEQGPGRSRRAPKQKRAPAPRAAKKDRPAKTPSPRQGKTTQYAGGRWKVKVLRALIYTVLTVLMLGGLKNVLTHKPVVTDQALARRVEVAMGITGYPTPQAEAFAVRFTKEYLTYNQNNTDARLQRLAIYSPAAANGDWGWTGSGNQSVITGPYVSAPTKVKGKHTGVVTVSAQLSNGQWVALAVPVYADSTGALVVSGPPAFVSQPALATNPGAPQITQTDDTLDASLTTDVMPGFLAAWAASDTTALARYVSTDATPGTKTGLAGAVTLDSVTSVAMPLTGGNDRHGTLAVLWKAPGGGSYAQTYNVEVVKQGDGRWYVKDIEGGARDEAASSSAATTPEGTSPTPTGTPTE